MEAPPWTKDDKRRLLAAVQACSGTGQHYHSQRHLKWEKISGEYARHGSQRGKEDLKRCWDRLVKSFKRKRAHNDSILFKDLHSAILGDPIPFATPAINVSAFSNVDARLLQEWKVAQAFIQDADVSSLQLPKSLSSWEAFCSLPHLFEALGKVAVYKRISEKPDVWTLVVDAKPMPERLAHKVELAKEGARYEVSAWASWYQQFLANKEWQTEAYYLSDVLSLEGQSIWKELVELNPQLKHLSDRASVLSLHTYLYETDDRIEIPNMDPLFYLAPVLPGNGVIILTPPHEDGFGSQAAFHITLFGSGVNLVYLWRSPDDTAKKSELYKTLSIPEKPTLPHNVNYSYRTSANREWDARMATPMENTVMTTPLAKDMHHKPAKKKAKKKTKKKVKQSLPQPEGEFATSVEKEHFFKRCCFRGGMALGLPAGYIHLFLKVCV